MVGKSFLQLSLNCRKVGFVNHRALPAVPANCGQPFICPLNQVRAGTAVRIRQLSGSPQLCHRLREMGLCEDQQIRLLSQNTNIICQVCNARLGISAELARTILVEPLTASPRAA